MKILAPLFFIYIIALIVSYASGCDFDSSTHCMVRDWIPREVVRTVEVEKVVERVVEKQVIVPVERNSYYPNVGVGSVSIEQPAPDSRYKFQSQNCQGEQAEDGNVYVYCKEMK